MKSTMLISVVMFGALLARILVATAPAETRPLLLGNGPNFRPGPNRPICGFGGCRRHWHHGHWVWGGALAGAAIVGAIATAAAANQGNCQLAIYDGAGNFIGYRQGNC